MKSTFILAALFGSLLFLAGCASDDHPKDQDQAQNHVNQLPWDRPEAYESQGPLGAFAPQMNTH
jgi:PBP1b-binding outer membrane lipoprotein LpoB